MNEVNHNNDVIHSAFEERCSKTRTRAIISANQSHQGFPTRSDVSIPVDGLSDTDLSSLGFDIQTCGERITPPRSPPPIDVSPRLPRQRR
jgi:hypothetical protein